MQDTKSNNYQNGMIIHNHPDVKYHQAPGLSSGAVKCFALKSPQHYYQAYVLKTLKIGISDAMQLGTLVHCLILEPNEFERRYQKELDIDDHPEALRTVAELKRWCESYDLPITGVKQEIIQRIINHDPEAPVWDMIKSRHQDNHKTTINKTLWDKAHYMADAVYKNQDAADLFRHGHPEVSIWSKNDHGQLLKCRCDWLRRDGIAIDLKTCRDSSPAAFSKDCATLGYALQDIHYTQTINNTESLNIDEFVFVAVESDPPYLCQVYVLDDHSRKSCLVFYHQVLEKIRDCNKRNDWPGYTDSISSLSLPVWHMKQMERYA